MSSRNRTAKPRLRGDVRKQVRDYLAGRDGGLCHYCRVAFGPDLAGATLDHYVPYRLWQMNKPRNLVLACGPCNETKADSLPPILALLLTHSATLHPGGTGPTLPLLLALGRLSNAIAAPHAGQSGGRRERSAERCERSMPDLRVHHLRPGTATAPHMRGIEAA
ncbi:HNH endonuclease [Streptomyces uncialis]|uniref:HNH endonuclease n=1 Tax=Streptomyces uncialis TaxID=1048205 RepID=UPI00224D57D3|nr:HNH endonuclease signature motif containing protein [Streptomyces uncialis]MCX4664712.1 HNH endonuclease [Streptomyces uncialis]